MILVEAGSRSPRALDAQLAFAAQLAARGHRAVIDASGLTDPLDRGRSFQAAPFLVDPADLSPRAVALLGAEQTEDAVLAALRDRGLAPGVPVVALGRFDDHQAYLGARGRIAHALGREPHVLDLAEMQPRPLVPGAVMPLLADLTLRERPRGPEPVLTIVLGAGALDRPEALPRLSRMHHSAGFGLWLVASGAQRDQIRASRFHDLPVVTFRELSPVTLAALTDVLAVYGQGVPRERVAALAVCLMGAGGVVLDCTEDRALLAQGAPALRGPEDPAALESYLSGIVFVNLAQIGAQTARAPWLEGADIARIERALGLAAPAAPAVVAPRPPGRTVFLPTNGVGLGHAQRCAVIAEAMTGGPRPVFAAFPSCVPMLTRRGFDVMPLVQKSETHVEPHANDLLTCLRLGRLVGPGDRLVFDGGYVFDSVFRTVLERGAKAAWVRRGLWPQGRASQEALDRERIFDRVIVPAEAFPELNEVYSASPRVHHVGPVLRHRTPDPAARAALRDRLAGALGRPFDRLVVSMLGGGVASDRTAQLQAISGMLAGRADVLHLIVVWPGGNVAPALYGWPNTRVVQTHDALALCLAADLTLSAAGYNSVHEVLYHRTPAIFIPQSAPYLDDQTRRARALSDRGLAETVDETELLRLERLLAEALEGDLCARLAAALAAAELPAPGAGDAARLIAAMAEEDA